MQATKPVKKPRKQRKRLYNAPAHLRHKFMAAPLSQELISSKGVKALPVRKGDTVRIMRGDNKGFEGKVSRIDLKKYRIFIEGLTREKVDGTNIFVSVHPSKVMIRNLKLDDKWRQGIVERKKELELPKKEKKAKKPSKKVTEVKKEKLPEKKPTVKPKAAQKKPVAKKKKEQAPAAEEKTVVKKKKRAKTVAKEKPDEKEKKPKAVKKALAKRKTAASKKKGGT